MKEPFKRPKWNLEDGFPNTVKGRRICCETRLLTHAELAPPDAPTQIGTHLNISQAV